MGLLDKLVKKTANKVASDIIENKLKETFGGLLDGNDKKPADSTATAASSGTSSTIADIFADPGTVVEKDPYDVTGAKMYYQPDNAAAIARFMEFLPAALPLCTFRSEVPLGALVPQVPRKYMDASIVVSKAGMPKAALLLVEKNRYSIAAIRFTKDALQKAGITPLCFMIEFRNESGYVIDRVKTAL